MTFFHPFGIIKPTFREGGSHVNDYQFGNFVCFLREKKGLTQADVARLLGVTPAAVSKWETGASKPRVEILFELANILEARPEELMAGRYIPEETLEPEAVKRINERYEYLRKIDSHATTNVKLRRMGAWLLDWNFIGAFVLFLMGLASIFFASTWDSDDTVMILFCIMLLYPVGFVLRDLIFGGRSLGKRIFGLIVLDKQTAEKAKIHQRIIRGLFLFILQFDLIVMLIRGESIGDTVARTVIISKKDISVPVKKTKIDMEKINAYIPPKPYDKKKIIQIILALLIAFALFFGLVYGLTSFLLHRQTQTEEYQMAYTYLVESEAFQALGISEDTIKFNSYSKHITTNRYGETSSLLEFGFQVDRLQKMTVVCHWNGETWYVCTDCTHF